MNDPLRELHDQLSEAPADGLRVFRPRPSPELARPTDTEAPEEGATALPAMQPIRPERGPPPTFAKLAGNAVGMAVEGVELVIDKQIALLEDGLNDVKRLAAELKTNVSSRQHDLVTRIESLAHEIIRVRELMVGGHEIVGPKGDR